MSIPLNSMSNPLNSMSNPRLSGGFGVVVAAPWWTRTHTHTHTHTHKHTNTHAPPSAPHTCTHMYHIQSHSMSVACAQFLSCSLLRTRKHTNLESCTYWGFGDQWNRAKVPHICDTHCNMHCNTRHNTHYRITSYLWHTLQHALQHTPQHTL